MNTQQRDDDDDADDDDYGNDDSVYLDDDGDDDHDDVHGDCLMPLCLLCVHTSNSRRDPWPQGYLGARHVIMIQRPPPAYLTSAQDFVFFGPDVGFCASRAGRWPKSCFSAPLASGPDV